MTVHTRPVQAQDQSRTKRRTKASPSVGHQTQH
ncbi:Uncharacterised protein [Vibrio cholerae]|nr:Uncharacterised protein [Vibrio cholerae]